MAGSFLRFRCGKQLRGRTGLKRSGSHARLGVGSQVGPDARLNGEPPHGLVAGPQEAEGAGEAAEPQAAHAPVRADAESRVRDHVLQLRGEAVQRVAFVGGQLKERRT